MIVRVWMAPSLGVWVGPSWSYRWRRQAVSMRASGRTSGEEQEGGCMQGRGRRDEDVDDEAVYDDVAYTERGTPGQPGGRAGRALGLWVEARSTAIHLRTCSVDVSHVRGHPRHSDE